ncbi:3-oxo-tetronate kinase [Agrococcus terreus]|uniref:3-oxo-tetronate kinase n=1 Tax=Agrococcus terreus TaxID=574649 RepID=A0ABQ2KCZ9_9MICO|nr:3-oxo-tetronate kinase [Agrococcus terreus]GGN77940.1 HPr kinase [Agrococcus terreus]
MQLGVIADDYTGATDLAGMLVRAGFRAIQHLGVPDDGASSDADVVVVALKSRSIPAAEAVEQSLAAARWLRARSADRLYFKYCSTFDSTDRGNIGPVATALADLVGAERVLFAPSVPENGRVVRDGDLFVHGVPLAESPMRDHPINPMRESDLRRVLAAQVDEPVGAVPLAAVRDGAEAVRAAVADAGPRLRIADAETDGDLDALALALADAPLLTGAAGLSAALGRVVLTRDAAADALVLPDGPAAVLSGSCSAATRRQVALHRAAHPAFEVDVHRIVAGEPVVEEAVAFVAEHLDERPLVYSSSDPEVVAAVQAELGIEASSLAIEAAFARIAAGIAREGVRRIVVAGGETSGAVVNGLGVRALAIGAEVDPGVPWTVALDGDRVGLLLKSGNFGGDDIFDRSLDLTEGSVRA